MVNTFLISSDFTQNAQLLDHGRLFKQCLEARQIINILENQSPHSHPAIQQWKGFTNALKHYYNCHLKEVYRRQKWKTQLKFLLIKGPIEFPWFVFCQQFQYSHMASLSRKNPQYYSFLKFPEEYQNYGYIWPSHLQKKSIDINQLHQYPLSTLCTALDPKLLIRCQAIIKSGHRKGEICNNQVKITNSIYCGLHKCHNKC